MVISDAGYAPRHRPGRRTRLKDVGAFLAANPSSDPLVGNYTVVPQNDLLVIFIAWSGGDMNSETADSRQSFPLTDSSPPAIQSSSEWNTWNVPNLQSQFAMAVAGEFTGGGVDTLAPVQWTGSELQLTLLKYDEGTDAFSILQGPVAIAQTANLTSLQAAAGFYQNGGGTAAQLAVMYVDSGTTYLSLWSINGTTASQLVGLTMSIAPRRPSNSSRARRRRST